MKTNYSEFFKFLAVIGLVVAGMGMAQAQRNTGPPPPPPNPNPGTGVVSSP